MDFLALFTNPLSPHDLMLGDDRFFCQGTEYPYTAVKSLRFFAEEVKTYKNFSHVWTHQTSELDILRTDQAKPIRIRGDGYKGVDDLRDAYVRLAEKTFAQRLQPHLDILQQYGCFHYDAKRFFPDGRATDGKTTVDLHVEAKNGKFLRRPFAVYVELPKSLVGKFVNRLAQRDVGIPGLKERNFVISTEHDQDVFFFLMKKFYRFEWE